MLFEKFSGHVVLQIVPEIHPEKVKVMQTSHLSMILSYQGSKFQL